MRPNKNLTPQTNLLNHGSQSQPSNYKTSNNSLQQEIVSNVSKVLGIDIISSTKHQ